MTKMLFAAAVLMTALSAPVFAADVPAKPPATTAKPATEVKPAVAKPKMMHKMKAMPMKAMPMKASATPVVKPAREPSTDKLNQQQLDNLKKS